MKNKLIIIFVLCFILSNLSYGQVIFAESEVTQTEIEQNVQDQLEQLDFSGLEDVLNKLSTGEIEIFGRSSFFEKVSDLLSGNTSVDGQGIVRTILNLLFDDLLNFMPLMALIIAIAITYSMIATSRPNLKKNSIGDIIHFVCYGAIIIIVCSAVIQMIGLTKTTILSIKNQMDVSFPILLTMLTALGGTTSMAVYQPAMALLSGTMMSIFSNILLPLFVFGVVFTIMSNLTSSIKFSKFADFFNSIFKWIIGIVFTIFLAFVSIQGITAGTADGISIKTAKYAIKNSVPVVGGYVSDGFSLILLSSTLIKNAIGAGGLILLLATIIVPVLKIVIFMFSLKFVGAVLEPIADNKISTFVSGIGKSMSLLIGIIVSIAFAYFVMSGLVMCSANAI